MTTAPIEVQTIALVAHDNKKPDLIEWAEYNRKILADHVLCATVAWNIPVACNRTTADFLICSPLFSGTYSRTVPGFEAHSSRAVASRP
jgi:methylglyoxal synthase